MRSPRRRRVASGVWTCAVLSAAALHAGGAGKPTRPWTQYASPGEAGYSAEKLDEARGHAEKIGSAAVFAVYRGHVVAAWGDVSRPFETHSVRKSLLSGLIGVYVGDGKIDLQRTMAELNIDDVPPLTDDEKQARVIDLLRSRSGVYHPAAKEPADMRTERPERGSHAPGEHFWYNNWDFNMLGIIFEQVTGEKVFEAFQKQIADPIGMEDYRLTDTYYTLEPSNSIHPAYGLRMSARDLARYGLLLARAGECDGRQVIPKDWIEKSTSVQSPTGGTEGYGYMWWVYPAGSFGDGSPLKLLNSLDKFSARGTGGQSLLVAPKAEFVFVHRADTENGRNVRGPEIWKLAEMMLAAREAEPAAQPKLVELSPVPLPNALPPPKQRTAIALDPDTCNDFVGEYVREPQYRVTVFRFQDRLFATLHGVGESELLPESKSSFFTREGNSQIEMVRDADGRVTHAVMNYQGKTEKLAKVK